MSTQKIRIAIIGCGGMARAHARRFETVLEQMDVVYAVDIVRERAQAVADSFKNEVKVAEDYREVLPHVDAVILVLPHHLHHPVAIDCLNAGKHVLVEKPMANSEQECLEMIEASKRNQRVLMVAYCMRFHPLVQELRRLIQEKTYGEVFHLSIWTEQFTHYEEGHWGRSAKNLGGGQLFSHGCHYVDLMLWILGKPLRGSHLGTNKGTPWMEKEGTSSLILEFENGVVGYHGATWGARGSRLRKSMHAHCTEGMIEADFSSGQLILHAKAETHIPDKVASQNQLILKEVPNVKHTEEEMAHFIHCIRTGTTPLTDPISSLVGLRLIWELYRAEEENRLADFREIEFEKFQ